MSANQSYMVNFLINACLIESKMVDDAYLKISLKSMRETYKKEKSVRNKVSYKNNKGLDILNPLSPTSKNQSEISSS
jgi:hypothetical protein